MATNIPSHLHSLLNVSCSIKVVDVGANPIDGVAPYAPLLVAGHTKVIGFEPNSAALEKLNREKGANEIYLPNAVGDGHRHTLRHCQAPGMTSLLQPNAEVLALFHGFSEWGRVIRTEDVDTVRLDDVPETASLDYLKIDIQGAELMVFENAVERLSNALLVHTEVEFLPMYVGQPLFSDVDRFLRRHGFVFHRFHPLTSRTIKPLLVNNDIYAGLSQVFWADAIFVRDFIHLGILTNAQLLRLAIILHDCYRSYDLALHLLIELDRRTGENHGKKYLGAITG
ncbi:MAG: FkbM family methyltransferase [Alphaproteobacteria bacterium]|nr:FkbM family methyltransferase [Alphaproteobacteria bacterium]